MWQTWKSIYLTSSLKLDFLCRQRWWDHRRQWDAFSFLPVTGLFSSVPSLVQVSEDTPAWEGSKNKMLQDTQMQVGLHCHWFPNTSSPKEPQGSLWEKMSGENQETWDLFGSHQFPKMFRSAEVVFDLTWAQLHWLFAYFAPDLWQRGPTEDKIRSWRLTWEPTC